jgi:hypothetical protein
MSRKIPHQWKTFMSGTEVRAATETCSEADDSILDLTARDEPLADFRTDQQDRKSYKILKPETKAAVCTRQSFNVS